MLPSFAYHPDPVATGSVAPSVAVCRACARARGFIYMGPIYAVEELAEALCPWCIADGSAAARFDADFTDPDGVGGYGEWSHVAPEIVEEVSRRTPGFIGWQQERWWTHCGDAARFLGRAGRIELVTQWPGAVPALRKESGYDDPQWATYFQTLNAEGSPCAYVFECRGCGALGGYSDVD